MALNASAAVDLRYQPGRYQPGLDGLRALAVIGAMLFHAGVLHGGFLGVDLFFVLSGYLITGLLLNERAKTATISLAGFYARRFRRLAPAFFLTLIVILVWAQFFAPAAKAPEAADQVGWSLAYLNNWYALFGNVGYWGAHTTALPGNHLWSLAIEEQFYLVWPVLLLLYFRHAGRLGRLRWLVAALAATSAVWQWVVADVYGADRAYLGTDTRFASLAVGATLAAVGHEAAMRARRAGVQTTVPPTGRSTADGPDGWSLAVIAAAGWLAVFWTFSDLNEISLYHGWFTSCSVAAAVLIAGVVANPTAWYSALLAARPLVWIGRRSYSLYLWHWPIWVMVDGGSVEHAGWKLWLLRIALTVGVSALSYAYVEQPIRTSSLSGRRLILAFGPLAAALAAVVVLVPPTLPETLTGKPVVLGARPSSPGAASSPGASSAGLRIMVTGDSWGRNMGYALALADPTHRNTVIDLGIPGCGLRTPAASGCSDQFTAWQHARETQHPDVAVLVEGMIDQGVAVQHDGPGAVCAPAYRTRYSRALDTAIATLRGPDHIPVVVTTDRDTVVGDQRSADCMNELLTAAAKRNSATVFDLHGVLCPAGPCVAEHDGQAVYDETDHLAPGGQRWVGGLLLAALHKRVTPRPENGSPTRAAGACAAGGRAVKAIAVRSYTVHPLPPYLDSPSHNLLTDGKIGKPTILDHAWLGWRATRTPIVARLAASTPICSASSTWLQDLGGAVVVPPTIDVYVSDDPRQLGRRLGSVQAPVIDDRQQTSTLTVTSRQPITGRYVTFQVNSFGSWAMVAEIRVLGLPAR